MPSVRDLFLRIGLHDTASGKMLKIMKSSDAVHKQFQKVGSSAEKLGKQMGSVAKFFREMDTIEKDIIRVSQQHNRAVKKLAQAYINLKWKVKQYKREVLAPELRKVGRFAREHAQQLKAMGVAATATMSGLLWKAQTYEKSLATLRALTADNAEEYEYYLSLIEKNKGGLFSKSDIAATLAYAKANRLTREELETLLPYAKSAAAMFGEDLQLAFIAMVRAMKYGEAELAERIGLQLRENAVNHIALKLYGKRLSQLNAEQKQRVIMLAIQEQMADKLGKENEIMKENIGKMMAARAAIDDLSTELGKTLYPAVGKAASILAQLLRTLDKVPLLKEFAAAGLILASALGALGIIAGPVSTALGVLGIKAFWASVQTNGLTVALKTNRIVMLASTAATFIYSKALSAANIATKLFGGALNLLRVAAIGLWTALGPIGIGLLALGAILTTLWFKSDKFRAIVTSLARGLREYLGKAAEWVSSKIQWLIDVLTNAYERIKPFIRIASYLMPGIGGVKLARELAAGGLVPSPRELVASTTTVTRTTTVNQRKIEIKPGAVVIKGVSDPEKAADLAIKKIQRLLAYS
jgi:hypothetical protein